MMFKWTKRGLAFLFFCVIAGVAWAGHTSVGVVVGPMWGPWYYPPAYYYPPYYPSYPPVIIQRAPQVYIEQYAPAPDAAPAPAPNTGNYWYYCPASKAYYPYVNECPGGWQKVAPQPPAPQ